MKTLKVLDWFILVISLILAWTLPISIFYGLFIGTLCVINLYISHKIKTSIIHRIVISMCIIVFYSIGLYCIIR